MHLCAKIHFTIVLQPQLVLNLFISLSLFSLICSLRWKSAVLGRNAGRSETDKLRWDSLFLSKEIFLNLKF